MLLVNQERSDCDRFHHFGVQGVLLKSCASPSSTKHSGNDLEISAFLWIQYVGLLEGTVNVDILYVLGLKCIMLAILRHL